MNKRGSWGFPQNMFINLRPMRRLAGLAASCIPSAKAGRFLRTTWPFTCLLFVPELVWILFSSHICRRLLQGSSARVVWSIERTVQVPSENRLNRSKQYVWQEMTTLLRRIFKTYCIGFLFGDTKTYRCRGSWPVKLANVQGQARFQERLKKTILTSAPSAWASRYENKIEVSNLMSSQRRLTMSSL